MRIGLRHGRGLVLAVGLEMSRHWFALKGLVGILVGRVGHHVDGGLSVGEGEVRLKRWVLSLFVCV